MLVHLRLTVPSELVDPVLDQLRANQECITNVVRVPGASLVPEGDLVECDVAREVTSDVLDALHATGLPREGGVVVSVPDSTPFSAAERIVALAPGDPDDAVIWPEVVERAEAAATPKLSYLAFLVIAVAIAGVAVIQDSPILVVGAMVVGPEFGAVAAVAVGMVLRMWGLAGRGAAVLIGGFGFAVLVVTGLALLAAATGLVDDGMLSRPRPQTAFIWRPDQWSLIVALLAGAAGALAMSTDRADALVGVLISVTTVPAAGNFALALALGDGAELVGSAEQLAVNLAGLTVAGVVVLLLQRVLWKRLLRLSDRVFLRA